MDRFHKRKIVLVASICFVMILFDTDGDAANLKQKIALDPANAVYIVDEQRIQLRKGHFEGTAAPDSATKIRISLHSGPVFGDLDEDGDEDAVMFLVFDPGGSGTFYYIVAAVKTEGGFRGTTAVLLGDRLTPLNLSIRNGMVVATYTDRSSGQSMATAPSIEKSACLVLSEEGLSLLRIMGENESVFEGWVTIGHEVRTFRPCSAKTDFWFSGHSPAIKDIKAAYRQMVPSDRPYTPLFMMVIGKLSDPPVHGFGASYPGAMLAAQLIHVWPKGNCKSEFIVVASPLPGAVITSPLKISGRAKGLWFF